ncbi:aldehyde dehydrogenase domain-containing protein [Mariannaea sp. PMI_226]|nr:aldehyde dehydrogenase domain-containing protein [Mariannaea sp. PMI_226]
MAASDVVSFFINGKPYHSKKTFDVVSPATGKVVHRCGNADTQDAELAVDAAAGAFPKWRQTTSSQRRDIFLKAAEIMESRRAELVRYFVDETGGTEIWGNLNIDIAVDLIKDVAGRISAIEGSFPTTKDPNTSAIVTRQPFGVVLSIAPWNAAYILGTRSVVFPVAAGNTVVLKATESAPKTMWAIASVFHEAGLPNGVLNTLSHEPAAAASVTSSLISNSHVKKINFTGSTNVGRIIGRLAGENLKPVVLELGGKAPAIVWEDADLVNAAKQCALGAFLNSGQICMSTERILVHKNVKEAFVVKLKEWVDALFPPDQASPVLINGAAVAKNKQLLANAMSIGATILHGDPDAQEASKAMMRPVILGNVTKDMDIYHIECFGPTVSIIEIETEEQAIEIANDTEYGLTSAVFTEDLRRGLRFAHQIESGAVHINSMSVHDEASLPHGGAKSSGFGRFNALSGLQEWVWTKNITYVN